MIKAALVRSALDDIKKRNPQLARAIRARMQPTSLEELDNASRVGWVRVEVDIDFTEALFAEAGSVLALETLRDAIVDAFGSKLLGGLMRTARAVLGNTLTGLLKWTPNVWGAVYRDCGRVVVEEVSPGRARIALEDLPLSVCESADYLRGTAAAIAGIYDVTEVDGKVELEGPDVEARRAVLHLRWR